MYKKITHNIIEEHFDHPIATKIKQSNDRKPKGWTVYSYEEKPIYLMDSINGWSKVSCRLGQLVVSITNGDEDTDDLMKHFDKDISKVSDMLKYDYGSEVSIAFANSISTVFQSLINVVVAIKNNDDTTELMATMDSETVKFSELVESVNPECWPKDVVYKVFSSIQQLYITQARSRLEKDWPISITAANDAFDIMSVCVMERHSFAWHFASGLGLS